MHRNPQVRRVSKVLTNMTNVDANTNEKIAAVAEQGANLTPQAAPSKKMDRHHKGASKTKKPIKAAAPEKQTKAKQKTAKATRKAAAPRNQRKSAKILELIGRAKGATLSEIMKLNPQRVTRGDQHLRDGGIPDNAPNLRSHEFSGRIIRVLV